MEHTLSKITKNIRCCKLVGVILFSIRIYVLSTDIVYVKFSDKIPRFLTIET